MNAVKLAKPGELWWKDEYGEIVKCLALGGG
jgi:hypothetical protein